MGYSQEIELVLLAEQEKLNLYWESGRQVALLMKEGKMVGLSLTTGQYRMGNRLYQATLKHQNEKILLDSQSRNLIVNYLKDNPSPKNPLQPVPPPVPPVTPKPFSSSNYKVGVILIDAGHGGKDPGSIGRHGSLVVNEKDVNLTVALELERLLKVRYPNKKILMTRSNDRYLTLEERVEISNNQKTADNEVELYISIHSNSAFNKEAKGFEVWRLPDNVTRPLFERDEVHQSAQKALNLILNEEYASESKILATSILKAMNKDLGKTTINRGQREQSWFVVKNAKMAAVLVEVGFVSNADEAKKLNDKNYLKLIAKTLYNGLEDFVNYFEK